MSETEHEIEQQEDPALDLSPAIVFLTIVVVVLAAAIVGSAFFPLFGG
jgi:hypothetical protein